MSDEFNERVMSGTARDWAFTAGLVVTCLSGLSVVIGLGYFASGAGMVALLAALMAMGFTVAVGLVTVLYAHVKTPEERVLTLGQRRDLRRARAALVMEQSLLAVQQEREKLIHRQIEESRGD